MTGLSLPSKSQNVVTRKKGSLNLAQMVNVSATKSSIPALTGHIPRKHQGSILPFPAQLYHLEDEIDYASDEVDFPVSFCLTGTALNPRPRQVSPLYLASKARSYVSSSNAEDSDATIGNNGNATERKRKRCRRKRSKSAKSQETPDESDGGSRGYGGSGSCTRTSTQKVVKMLPDGSLLLCRVPVPSTVSRVRRKERSRSRSRTSSSTHSRTRSVKSPVSPTKSSVSPAAKVRHQLAKSVVCFKMQVPHEPICFTVKRENRNHRSSPSTYYYHDEQLCNRCRLMKKKRALLASLRAPKFKNFGVQTDLREEGNAPVEKPHSPLVPSPTKTVITSTLKTSSGTAEAACTSPKVTEKNDTCKKKLTTSKSVNPESASSILPKSVISNPVTKTTLPSVRNSKAPLLIIPKSPPKSSLSKEIVNKSRMAQDDSISEEDSRAKGEMVRLRSFGHNRSLFLLGPSSASSTDFKLTPLHGVCQASA